MPLPLRFCHHWAKQCTIQIADIANLPRLIMCAQCDSNVSSIPGLIFGLQYYNSWKWKSDTSVNQRTKSERPGNEADCIGYFSSIYYYLLSHCSFLKCIDHHVLNAVTWHQ